MRYYEIKPRGALKLFFLGGGGQFFADFRLSRREGGGGELETNPCEKRGMAVL